MTTAPQRGATGGEFGSPPVAGVDTGSRHERDADATVHAFVAALQQDPGTARWRDSLEVTTHFVGEAPRHVALAVTADVDADAFAAAVRDAARRVAGPSEEAGIGVVTNASEEGPPELRGGAEEAAAARASRASGRAVHFPGVEHLTGELAVADVVRLSAIDRVQLVTGADAGADERLLTREFVRPLYLGGELVLPARPAIGGVLVPFEVPDPTPCCADHA